MIDWGKGALAWHQWYRDRPAIEIPPTGRALPPFRDYLRVHLTFDDLQRLATQPDANRDWVAGLSAVGAVYLIVDSVTGEQYVGSATGTGGLWQRWWQIREERPRRKSEAEGALWQGPLIQRRSILHPRDLFEDAIPRRGARPRGILQAEVGDKSVWFECELSRGLGAACARARNLGAASSVERSVTRVELTYLSLFIAVRTTTIWDSPTRLTGFSSE